MAERAAIEGVAVTVKSTQHAENPKHCEGRRLDLLDERQLAPRHHPLCGEVCVPLLDVLADSLLLPTGRERIERGGAESGGEVLLLLECAEI